MTGLPVLIMIVELREINKFEMLLKVDIILRTIYKWVL